MRCADVRPRTRARPSHGERWSPTGHAVRPAAACPAATRRTSSSCARGWTLWLPGAALRGDRPVSTTSPKFAASAWLAGRGQDRRAAAMTAAVCGCCPTLDEAVRLAARTARRGYRCLVEETCAMRRELAALVARSPFGQGCGVAGGADRAARRHLRGGHRARARPDRTSGASGRSSWRCGWPPSSAWSGVLAVELFETVDGALLVNELAMRPHNSGHWTMDGARTSQFEQHLRAVLDYPLGRHRRRRPGHRDGQRARRAASTPAMSVDERLHHLFARMPEAQGASVRQGRTPGPQDRPRQHPRRRSARLDDGELAADWL